MDSSSNSAPREAFAQPANASLASDSGDTSDSLTVQNLLRLLRKHAFLVLACLVATSVASLFWTLGQPKIYRSEVLLRLDPNPPKPLGNRVELVSDSTSWWNRREFYETEFRVMRSSRITMATVRQLGLHGDGSFVSGKKAASTGATSAVADVAAVLAGRLSVDPVKDSSLVYLRYEDTDPARAQRVLTTHVRVYLDQNLEQTTALSTTALEWLNDQLGTLKDDLEKSEKALAEFRLKNNVLSLSLEDRHNLITTQLEAVVREITTLEIQRIEVSARSASLKKISMDDPMAASHPDLLASALLTSHRQNYATFMKEKGELQSSLGENHPKVVAAQARLDATRKAIESELSNIKAAAASQLTEIDRRLGDLRKKDDELQKQAHELQQFEVPFNQLMRTKTQNEKIYGLVLERARETSLTRMMNFNNIRIVEEASLPTRPFKPNVGTNLGVGALAGMLIGLALAALRELGDQSLKTPNDVEAQVGVSCLGLLPEISEVELGDHKRDLHVAKRPESSAAEAMRVIRTNLSFMSPDRPYKTVVVTSALPEEGKTTVSCSLAIALAQSGHRVVIVDADLRRPRVHRVFSATNDIGVSLVVAGETSLDDAIRPSEVPNLDVLMAGPTPPNPAELLHSDRFRKLIDDLRAKYDRVVIDSPPTLPVTDSAILSQVVDGTILVARGFKTPRNAVRQAMRRLRDVNGHLIGIVLNAVNLRDTAYKGSYYYAYDSGYYRRDES